MPQLPAGLPVAEEQRAGPNLIKCLGAYLGA